VDGNENLLREGVPEEKIHLVGNVMIDTLVHLLPKADDSISHDSDYALVTLHRPSNVDEPHMLRKIISTLDEISKKLQVIFPIHPRTRSRMKELKLTTTNSSLKLIDPIGYLQFLALQKHATVLITDSGGIQEETTYLGVPCLTVRENTERPVTITTGTNMLIGTDMEKLKAEVDRILSGEVVKGAVPTLWDGKASERIARVIKEWGLNPL
jgi:UDP-N-acetylglucosamine 2-epimerase (non-hydrolysing)